MRFWTNTDLNPFNWIVGEPVIGKDCWIGLFTLLDASSGLIIGDNVVISSGVHIYSHESISRHEKVTGVVIIEDNVIIGANAVILPGVTIAKGAKVGAGAVVLKDTFIGENEIWVGVPARKVGETDE